jgi:hypothetical protein
MLAPALLSTLTRITCVLVLLVVGGLTLARAQTVPVRPAPSPFPTPNERRNDGVDFGSRENDARTRLALKADKKAYQEHLARAKEAAELALELEKAYELAHLFNAADRKKLERVEKLVRRVRNEVGGSQTDADPKDLPRTTDQAIPLMVEMTKALHEEVERTPRRVISASIIEQANKLIALIQYLRGDRD